MKDCLLFTREEEVQKEKDEGREGWLWVGEEVTREKDNLKEHSFVYTVWPHASSKDEKKRDGQQIFNASGLPFCLPSKVSLSLFSLFLPESESNECVGPDALFQGQTDTSVAWIVSPIQRPKERNKNVQNHSDEVMICLEINVYKKKWFVSIIESELWMMGYMEWLFSWRIL